MRTGTEYLRSLNDGRRVFAMASSQGRHRASGVRQAARSIANLYDIAAAPEMRERMTFISPKTGKTGAARLANSAHARRFARTATVLRDLGRGDVRLMGRAPDHVAGFFRRYAATPKFSPCREKFADNLVAFYEYMRDNHIYASYAIVPPQIDRSKPAHQQSDPTLYAGVVKERDDGIVISGAQQLATAARLRLYPSELHPAVAAGRRELRQLPRRSGLSRGRQALSEEAVLACRQRGRLSAVEPVRRVRQLRDFRQRVRALGARFHLPQRRAVARSVAQDAVAPARQSTRHRCAT